jgi:RNA polymerase sigma-70 factor (ECF subfamily)
MAEKSLLDPHNTAITAYENASDEELFVASLKKPTLFSHLVERYEEAFIRKAQTIVFNREDAEDIVQETFTRIYMYAKNYEKQDGATFRSWAYKILMNTTFTHYQKLKKTRERTIAIDPEVFEFVPEAAYTTQPGDELKDFVATNLSRIPTQLARALSLHFLEDRSQKEIAEMEDTSVSAIKTRIYRGKQEMKKLLESPEEKNKS